MRTGLQDKIARYLVYVACGDLVSGRALARRFGLCQSHLVPTIASYNAKARREGRPVIESRKGPDGGYFLRKLT